MAILRHPLGDADRLTHLMSFGDQADPQKTADGRLVVDDQYAEPFSLRLLIERAATIRPPVRLRVAAAGMRMQVPLPLGPANAQMRPPWTSIIAREMASQARLPPRLPQSPTGWVNRLKILSRSDSAMPTLISMMSMMMVGVRQHHLELDGVPTGE